MNMLCYNSLHLRQFWVHEQFKMAAMSPENCVFANFTSEICITSIKSDKWEYLDALYMLYYNLLHL